jgi:sulfur-carrier protein
LRHGEDVEDDVEVNELVTIRFYAAARSAVGMSELLVAPGSLDHILLRLTHENSRLGQIFVQCSFLLDGVVLHGKQSVIPAGSTLDVLPPFAGG